MGLLAPRLTPNLEDQVSVFMTPGERVAQLYPQALGSSGTSGVPLPIPTIVGPWGEQYVNTFLILLEQWQVYNEIAATKGKYFFSVRNMI
jgi:hypothetical protein